MTSGDLWWPLTKNEAQWAPNSRETVQYTAAMPKTVWNAYQVQNALALTSEKTWPKILFIWTLQKLYTLRISSAAHYNLTCRGYSGLTFRHEIKPNHFAKTKLNFINLSLPVQELQPLKVRPTWNSHVWLPKLWCPDGFGQMPRTPSMSTFLNPLGKGFQTSILTGPFWADRKLTMLQPLPFKGRKLTMLRISNAMYSCQM